MDDEKIYIRKVNTTTEERINFIIGVLESCKFDIGYQDKLKMPLTAIEEEYFEQAKSRIDSSIGLLEWLKTQIKQEVSQPAKTDNLFTRIRRLWSW